MIGENNRSGNILRFPRAAGEPPCAIALRCLTYAFPPAGVYVYFLRYVCASFVFNIKHFSYVPVSFSIVYSFQGISLFSNHLKARLKIKPRRERISTPTMSFDVIIKFP